MILNKEKGKRMWGGDGGSGGSGGSGFDPSSLSGYAQQSWVNDNFVSKAFFNQMFELQYSQRVLTKDGDTVISDVTTDLVATPNTFIDTTTQTRTDEETGYTIETTNTITGIKAKVGLWTPSYLSALGQNSSGGGGGGATLFEPLLSINESGLAAPAAAQDGMTVVWDNTNRKWKYGATGGGNYLPLTGGTLTNPNWGQQLRLLRPGGTPSLYFSDGTNDFYIYPDIVTPSNKWVIGYNDGTDHYDTIATEAWVNSKHFINYEGDVAADFNFADGHDIGGGVYQLHTVNTQTHKPATYGILVDFESVNGHLQLAAGHNQTLYIRSYWWTDNPDGFTYPEWQVLPTQSWIGQNYLSKTEAARTYLSIAFFNRLFQARNGSTAVNPNDTTSTIDNIKAMFGFWTDQYISALGQNSGGGGGGVSLNEPLSSINTSNMIAPTAAQDGMTIVWDNATQKWKYGSAGGGGGVTSITAGTGLSGGTITDSGTIAINSTYQNYISHGETAYGWGNHANEGYATQTWVGQQGFLTQTAADSRYISISFFARLFQAKNGSANVNPNDTTSTIDSIKALFGFWTDQYISALGQNSGGGGGGVSLNEPLSSINTSGLSAPGASQDGMTIVWDNATHKWKYGSAGGGSYTLPLAANGTRGGIQIGFTTDGANRNYAVLLSGEKAYVNVPWTDTDTWRPVQDNLTSTSASDCLSANQGKVLKGYIDTLNGYFTNGSAKTALKLATACTIWGRSFDGSANITGNIYAGSSGGSIEQFHSIELNSAGTLSSSGHYGGFIDFHYDGSAADYTSRIIEDAVGQLSINAKDNTSPYNYRKAGLCIGSGVDESYLQIGDIRLIYDQTNNAIKAEKSNGHAANFYATGGVSALGVPTSGSGTVDTLNVNTLKAVNNLYIGDSANSIYYDYDDDTLFIQSGSGDIALKGSLTMRGINTTQRSISTQGGNLSLGGGYIYLSSSVYLYTDGSNVKVSINGTSYTLNKS